MLYLSTIRLYFLDKYREGVKEKEKHIFTTTSFIKPYQNMSFFSDALPNTSIIRTCFHYMYMLFSLCSPLVLEICLNSSTLSAEILLYTST